MVLIASFVMRMNFHARDMAGLLHYYQNFKKIILAGFDPSAVPEAIPTFPMWGYGWLMIITESPLALLIFQNALAIFSVGYMIRILHSEKILKSDALLYLKILLIVSIPWFAFHSLRWPNSIANSLFILSFTLFLRFFLGGEKGKRQILLSGLLFGIALNFRSDYYLLPLGWAAIICFFSTTRMATTKSLGVWLFVIYLMLTPWALYSKRATDHFLFTSTNGGAVLFIGLGAMPDNKWGITPVDGDPKMHEIIKTEFGPDASFLSPESDQHLKSVFLEYALKDPLEYSKKVLYVFRRLVTGGMYSGEFYESEECYPNCRSENKSRLQNIISDPIHYFSLERKVRVSTGMTLASIIIAKTIVFISFLTLPFAAFWGITHKNLPIILLHSSIIYFSLLISLSNYLASYTCNMYILHGINLAFCIQIARQYYFKPIPTTQATTGHKKGFL